MKKSSHLVPLVQDPEPYFAAKQCFIVLVPAVACHEPDITSSRRGLKVERSFCFFLCKRKIQFNADSHLMQRSAFSAVGSINAEIGMERKFSISLQKCNSLPQMHMENAVM